MTLTAHELPRADAAGSEGTWRLPTTENIDLRFTGRFLGYGSSRQPEHRDDAHPGGYDAHPIPLRNRKCQSCRWYEVRIFRETEPANGNTDKRFLIYHVGATIVPGEDIRPRYRWTASAHAVIEDLTTRERGTEAYIAPPSARALAEAAGFDEDLEDAWINRVIA